MLGVAEVPHGEHPVLGPGHEDVRLRGVSGQTPHSAALQYIGYRLLLIKVYPAAPARSMSRVCITQCLHSVATKRN